MAVAKARGLDRLEQVTGQVKSATSDGQRDGANIDAHHHEEGVDRKFLPRR